MDEAGGIHHVVGRPQDAGQAPNFVKKAPDVVEAAEAADVAADVLEGADDAQGPAQTRADVAGAEDDVLEALETSAGLLELR